jgi:hypothetical protein
MCASIGRDDFKTTTSYPVFLPDGNHYFYTGQTQGDDSSRGVYLAALDNPASRKILDDYSSVVYSPAVAGGLAHLLFLRENTLMAQPFDADKWVTVGDPFPVAWQASNSFAGAQVAASVSNGTLVYVAGRSTAAQLTWFDQSGKELGKAGPQVDQTAVVMSPDGNAVLTRRLEPNGQRTMWLYDLARNSERRFLSPGPGGAPVWSPDGRRVFTVNAGAAGFGLYQKDATAGGEAEMVVPSRPALRLFLPRFRGMAVF